MNIVKTISAKLGEKGMLIVKFLRYGKNDVQETHVSLPFGFDCMPVKDMEAVYAPTGEMGASVLVGFINRNLVSKVGESGLYSTNESGEIQVYLRLKDNGEIHFGGDAGNLARFQELEEGFNDLKSKVNSLINKYNTHIHPTPAGASSVTTTTETPSTASIAGAKIDEFKTL
jgi:hypothetical protein